MANVGQNDDRPDVKLASARKFAFCCLDRWEETRGRDGEGFLFVVLLAVCE